MQVFQLLYYSHLQLATLTGSLCRPRSTSLRLKVKGATEQASSPILLHQPWVSFLVKIDGHDAGVQAGHGLGGGDATSHLF